MNSTAFSGDDAMRCVRRLLPAVVAGLFSVIPCGASDSPPARPAVKPNFVIVLIDDFAAQALRCYGSATDRDLHNIESMARNGAVLENCHAQPMCAPSRAALMTGLYAFRRSEQKERGGTPFIGSVLAKVGYRNAIFGKWMVGGYEPAPRRYGFHEAVLQINGYRQWNPCFVAWGHTGIFKDVNQGDEFIPESEWSMPYGTGPGVSTRVVGGYAPAIESDMACDFIRKNKDNPYFLYLALKIPHDPVAATPDSVGVTEADKLIEDDWRKMQLYPADKGVSTRRFYRDTLRYIDRIVGEVRGAIADSGSRERTLLFFASDNGTNTQSVQPGVVQIKGRKGSPLMGATHVPFLLEWPGTVPGGLRIADLVCFEDVMPTLADLAGAEAPVPCDGISFAGSIRGEKAHARKWAYFHGGNNPISTRRSLSGAVSYDPGAKGTLLRWAFDDRFKLYNDGRLLDYREDGEERSPIASGRGSPEAEAARAALAHVLDSYADRNIWRSDRDAVEPIHDPGAEPWIDSGSGDRQGVAE